MGAACAEENQKNLQDLAQVPLLTVLVLSRECFKLFLVDEGRDEAFLHRPGIMEKPRLETNDFRTFRKPNKKCREINL